jgi:hypothetical protein
MPRGQNAAPTVEQINKDRITLVSEDMRVENLFI